MRGKTLVTILTVCIRQIASMRPPQNAGENNKPDEHVVVVVEELQ